MAKQSTSQHNALVHAHRLNNDAVRKRIAIVTMGVKLGNETRGYTRFRAIAEILTSNGFEVDLITSSFQHWEKAQRNTESAQYKGFPYQIVFINEPGYTKNLDLARIKSHRTAAKNLREHFQQTPGRYSLIYCEIPPNDVARVCAEYAHEQGIPFVADINDLWPEAMRMVVDIPVVSSVAFYPFSRDAHVVYTLLDGAIGTSDEYAQRPAKDRKQPYPHETVYVGNNLAEFDAGAKKHAADVVKPANEIWVSYAGTLGASYDIATLIRAGTELEKHRVAQVAKQVGGGAPAHDPVRIKILGDGPNRAELEKLATSLQAPVDFLGYCDYGTMAAYLCASDVLVNSLVKSAAQSIVTKIGDYLASGKPIVNTGSSTEFRTKVSTDGFGVNVEAEDVEALTDALESLVRNPSVGKIMGAHGRKIAETEFDQPQSYKRIVNLIRGLLR